jgi:hypothetical protein
MGSDPRLYTESHVAAKFSIIGVLVLSRMEPREKDVIK